MELLLIQEGIWDIVHKEIPEVPHKEWLLRMAKLKQLLVCMSKIVDLDTKKQTTAKGAWNMLKKYHQKTTLSNTVTLITKLRSIKLQEGGDMEKHISAVKETMGELIALGKVIADKLAVAFMPSSLTDSYATLITALETRPEGDLTLSLVKMKMIDEYKHHKRAKEQISAEKKAMKIQAPSKNCKFNNCSVQQVPTGSVITCFFCKKPGHFMKVKQNLMFAFLLTTLMDWKTGTLTLVPVCISVARRNTLTV